MRGKTEMRCIIHIDMDAFFASVEQLDDRSLIGRPVLVGGPSPRGVVSAASYKARSWGVRSAMPMLEALRKCPTAVVIRPRFQRYAQISSQIFTLFDRYTPLVEGLSLDEAFLDVTGSIALFGSARTIAQTIKDDIQKEIGLTASAGVAPCKFAAKIASDLEKPNGLVIVPPDVKRFIAPLPIERMWGVGTVAKTRLRTLGIKTIGDLSTLPESKLVDLFGSWGNQMAALARGIDDRPVNPQRPVKSIGSEETFERDVTSVSFLRKQLLKHSERIARRLTRAELWALVVRIKVKYSDFRLVSRQYRFTDAVMDTDSIYRVCQRLLEQIPQPNIGIRLIGVTVTELTPSPSPKGLFPDRTIEKRQRIERISDRLFNRFGTSGITRASLIEDSHRSTDQKE